MLDVKEKDEERALGPQTSPQRKSHEVTAWQIGVDRFLSTLPPDIRLAFKAPVSADDCLQLLQAAQIRNRKFDRLISILQPLIEPLKRFESSVDVLVQTYSSIASPIWGPIKILVSIASTRLSTLHNVIILLERLVEPLRRFHNYELMFKKDASLRQAIGNLYCDLVEFCARLVAHERKSPLRKTFVSFDKDIAEISDNIRFHWAEVDVAANAANIAEAKVARVKEQIHQAHELERDINRWLSPATVEDDLHRLFSSCADSSCQWVLKTPEMMEFRNVDAPKSLRLCSWPGGGKSVAASFLVKFFQSTPELPVLYFFCRSTDAEKTFTTSVARTLIWQLLQTEPSLYTLLAPIYHRCGRQTADSEVIVFEIFESILKKTSHKEIYIVIDALDECHDTSTLLNLLTSVQNSATTHLKLLITSRDDPDLSRQLSFCTSKIFLQENQDPLARYINDNIASLPIPITAEQRAEIGSAIEAGSAGLWLFAKLMIEEIRKASSIAEMYEQIQTVPDDLAQLYNAILITREKTFSKRDLRRAQQIYLWLRMAEYIPQDLWKARSVSGLEDEVIMVLFQYLTKSESEILTPMELVLRLCSPLVTTRLLHEGHLVLFLNGKPVHCSAFIAEFFHQTADQYLQWCSEAKIPQIPASMQPRRLADLHRGVCAAWYFGDSRHFKSALQNMQERPRSGYGDCWIEMACGLWQALSIKQIRKDLSEDEMDQAQEMCESLRFFLSGKGCLGFVEASIILHYTGGCNLLADNVVDEPSPELLTPISSRARPEFLETLISACELFKADLLYSVTRFPATSTYTSTDELTGLKPEGFDGRARDIFALARKYRYLAWAPQAVSINGFLFGGKS
jgi:hypothetical protein